MPSTTSDASSISSSTRRPTIRSSSRAAAWPPVDALATGGGRVISGGNFHGEPIALALDFAKIALAELGSISERRTALLVDPRLNGGLPPFLAAASGIDSGMMIYQYTAAALASREQGARPSGLGRLDPDEREPGGPRLDGVDLRPARADASSRASSGSCSIELLVATQALDLRLAVSRIDRRRASAWLRHGLACGPWSPHLDEDREPGPDLAAALDLVHDGCAGRPRGLTGRRSEGQRANRERVLPAMPRSSVCRKPVRRRTVSISSTKRPPSGLSANHTR